MTISYSAYVSTSGGIPSCFIKLLRRWRGSIYKLIYCDLLVYLGIFFAINLVYRFLLNNDQKETFGHVVSYFSAYNSQIPITFVLGFYVSIVVGRWCQQVWNMPWPDPVAIFVSSQIRGHDDNGRKMRRTVMRYICLAYIMVFSLISPRVKKRFPTLDHLVEVGVLVENEKNIIKAMDEVYPKQPKYWMPIVWASSIFTRARKEGRIRDDFALRTLNDAINQFRQNCILLLHYDTISIPLVYTQVVTLAVYSYFLASLIGNQWIHNGKQADHVPSMDFYFPLSSTMEFFFFMGWLKVAETLICPFGEDDDDFEINSTIDRNIQVSYIIVDEMHNRHPQLMKDQYWDEVYPVELPGGGNAPPEHSTAHIEQKPFTPKTSELSIGFVDSKTKFLWKRVRDDQANIIQMGRQFMDSDHTFSEQLVRKHEHSWPSEGESTLILQSEFEEEGQEEQEIVEGYTFERLREEREREKIERQQHKVQRTVDNAAEVTAELPVKMQKRPVGSGEKSIEDSEKADQNYDIEEEEDDIQRDDEKREDKK